jgi:SAM-dependent methyltransferase
VEKSYYREYFDLERNHWWFRARAEVIVSHLRSVVKATGPLKILNVGAGPGRTSELLAEFGTVTSMEYDGDCCKFTKELTGLELLQASITELPFPTDSFDLVCCFDVIEHVERDRVGVEELRRVCRSGGLVCITVPAFMFLWSKHDEVNHHQRRYTASTLRSVTTGLSPVFESYFNFWLFFPISAFRLLASILPQKTREDSGSDFFAVQSPLLDRIFYTIFRTEAALIRFGIRLPVGVSILSTGRK